MSFLERSLPPGDRTDPPALTRTATEAEFYLGAAHTMLTLAGLRRMQQAAFEEATEHCSAHRNEALLRALSTMRQAAARAIEVATELETKIRNRP
jgi:hypothetical protein